jgi:hypothetical protein
MSIVKLIRAEGYRSRLTLFLLGLGVSEAKIRKGEMGTRRRGLSRATRLSIPRLALWAGVGIFVLAAGLSCSDVPATRTSGLGFVYVGTMDIEKEPVYKLDAGNGEKILGLTGDSKGGLSIDGDPGNGDAYVYTLGYLRKYSPGGKLRYKVNVDSGWLDDSMVFDFKYRVVWIHTTDDGEIKKFDAANGKYVNSIFTGVTAACGLVKDYVDDALWLTPRIGSEVYKYSAREGKLLLKIKIAGWVGPVALDRDDGTILVSSMSEAGKSIRIIRYDKNGKRVREYLTGFNELPATVGVEPATGIIWVSDGERTERYNREGTRLDPLSNVGFVVIDFNADGTLTFGIDKGRTAFALRTNRGTDVLWSQKVGPFQEDYWAIKFCDK